MLFLIQKSSLLNYEYKDQERRLEILKFRNEQYKAEQNKMTIKNQIREYSFNRYLEFTNCKLI